MSKRKLLLADDSMTIQKVVNLTFADEGIEVFTVGNGAAAVEKLDEIEPDLVLADVHMPGLTGYEVCESIRQNPQYKDIPVMLLVGSFEPFDEAEMRRVGANDFLTKPFQSIRQLVQKVTTLLEETQPTGGTVNGTAAVAAEENNAFDFNATIPQMPVGETQTLDESYITAVETTGSTGLGDAGMDDEMIESSSGNNFSTGYNDFSNPLAAPPVDNEYSYQIESTQFETTNPGFEPVEPEIRQTSPLSYADIQEIGSADNEPQPQQDWQSFELETPSVDTAAPVYDFQPSGVEQQREEDVYELDSTDFEITAPSIPTPTTAAEESEDILQSEGFAPPPQYQAQSQEAVKSESSLLEIGDKPAINLDDLDDDSILDLGGDEPVYEPQSTAERQTGMEILPLSNQTNAAGSMFDEQTNTALTQIGNQALAQMNLQFPPEVIEAIAQRVVEKLSDKVIEKIAWEIVPDRFDLIVRKHIQDRDR